MTISVGIVNDMTLAVEALKRALALDASINVLWVARDGAQAVALCAENTPDVVLMDLFMPVMNGVEATRRIMAESPCAIVVVTSDVLGHTSGVFEAMGHGALDAVDTPILSGGNTMDAATPLLRKIRNIGWLVKDKPVRHATVPPCVPVPRAKCPLVAIGASAGGPATLAQLLSELPANFPAGIVLVQHVDASFADGMASWLDGQSKLHVKVAEEGDQPEPGLVLLAGTNDHLRCNRSGLLQYSAEPRAFLYRPSIDVFFDSVIAHWRGETIGVLLTGMGRDGAEGLKRMRDHGFFTIAQDEASSAVYGMPKAAAALDAASAILPLEKIATTLIERFRLR